MRRMLRPVRGLIKANTVHVRVIDAQRHYLGVLVRLREIQIQIHVDSYSESPVLVLTNTINQLFLTS